MENITHLLFSYPSRYYNIGDYIQTFAAAQAIKSLDISERFFFVNRENLSDFKPSCETRVVMQGWFAHGDKFIPNENLKPLYIGFHLAERLAVMGMPARIKGFNNSSIGCRDLKTLKYFENNGYFSRCLTLALDKTKRPQNPQEIIVVCYDGKCPSDNFLNFLPVGIREQASVFKHRVDALAKKSPEENLMFAKSRLDIYSQAKIVITNLLHCAAACVAMGVPTLFVNNFCNDIENRRTALSGILPVLDFADLKRIDYDSVPTVNIERLKSAIRQNFKLSYKQAFLKETWVET